MNTTPTAARPTRSESSHYYFKTGVPCYEVPYADPKRGMRPTTLLDARKLNLLPSVTTILSAAAKPALVNYLIEMAVVAALTTPRQEGEELDAFVHRVIRVDQEQDSEARKARELGTAVHDELAAILGGQPPSGAFTAFTVPALALLEALGKVIMSEMILVGHGYAGKTDLVMEGPDVMTVVDFKTCKKLPQNPYPEHRMQLGAYATALGKTGTKPIQTANLYISTTEPGKVVLLKHENWKSAFEDGFVPLLKYWSWVNGYKP